MVGSRANVKANMYIIAKIGDKRVYGGNNAIDMLQPGGDGGIGRGDADDVRRESSAWRDDADRAAFARRAGNDL